MVLPGTVDASPRGRAFQFSSSSGGSESLAKVHGVISNRDLSSTSGRQPRNLLGNLESTTHAWCGEI